jgi:ADP-ribosylglycohydrolase
MLNFFMDNRLTFPFLGSLVADALAMPGHWYYDRIALHRDYGRLDHYLAPKNPHPDSILWRSRYEPPGERGDILREQAQYWGRHGVHYHQFLEAGGNTINFLLAAELYKQVQADGCYDPNRWLERYVACMLEPGWHRDTYVEEYHRAFFANYARGTPLLDCGIDDVHIGGLCQVPALFSALGGDSGDGLSGIVSTHVRLTHGATDVVRAAGCLTRLLVAIRDGRRLRNALATEANDWFSTRQAELWLKQPDTTVVGRRLSPACYIDDAFRAALYIAYKYHDDFEAGIIANAMVGGDNCHRGAVVGALLGAENGIPERWIADLKAAPS